MNYLNLQKMKLVVKAGEMIPMMEAIVKTTMVEVEAAEAAMTVIEVVEEVAVAVVSIHSNKEMTFTKMKKKITLIGDQVDHMTIVITMMVVASILVVVAVVPAVVVAIKTMIVRATTREILTLAFPVAADNNTRLKEVEVIRTIWAANHQTKFLSLIFLNLTLKKTYPTFSKKLISNQRNQSYYTTKTVYQNAVAMSTSVKTKTLWKQLSS
jgi:hypothetical protein